MAIRDRITIHTLDGRSLQLEVTKQGGSIHAPNIMPRNGSYRALIADKNDEPTIEAVEVPVDNISAVIFDQAEKKARKTKG